MKNIFMIATLVMSLDSMAIDRFNIRQQQEEAAEAAAAESGAVQPAQAAAPTQASASVAATSNQANPNKPFLVQPAEGVPIECTENSLKKAASFKSTQGNGSTYPGSTKFTNCDSLSRGHFSTLYKNGVRSSFNWKNYINFSCSTNCNSPKDFDDCTKNKADEVKYCESAAYVISFYDRDWNDSEQIKATKTTGNARVPQQGANATGASAVAAASAASSLKCISEGIETLDYDGCKKFTDQLEVIEAVQQVSYNTQEVIYKDKMADASIKNSTNENAATGALKAAADSLKMQQDMYQQRTAVDATKLAYLYSIYNEIPRSNDIYDKCRGISQRIQSPVAIGLNDTLTDDQCRSFVSRGGFALAQNQAMLEQMRTKLIAIATSLGSNTLLASLMGKRASDANNAIAKIEDFKPVDPTVSTEEDAKTTFCAQNPGLAQCLTSDLDSAFGNITDNVITFGEGGTGTTYGSTNALSDGTTSASGTTSTNRDSVTPMGSVITDANRDNSIEASKAASVTSGGAGGASPGGGGGGASANSGGGGGGPTAPAGAAAAMAPGKAPAYSGGSGSISVVGGLGIKGNRGDGKSEDNPFGKLFGKDNKNGGDLNFRDPASSKVGDKKDNLFEMISKRYTSVNADKRLLEYELAK